MIGWSPSTGHFYPPFFTGSLPEDCVRITPRRHAELLDGQRQGRAIVPGANGKPALSPVRKPSVDQLRTFAVADIKAEASRRILAVASLARQANDNAVFALRSLNLASAEEFDAAFARRAAIDAVRVASNTLEHKIATWSALALSSFDAADAAHWPVEG